MNSGDDSVGPPLLYRTHRAYAVRFYGRSIFTTVATRAVAVRSWIYQIRRIHGHRFRSLVVGLGVQWRPKIRRDDPDPPVATIQLCVGRRCLIFQVLHACSIPADLRRFLSNPLITFVGVGNRFDCRKLRADCGLDVANGREIRDLALGIMGRWNVSMEDLAKVVLRYDGVKKPKKIGRSAWDEWSLSREQVRYACVDAYIAFELGLKLLR